MPTIKERLYDFLNHKGLKAAAFERKCGLANGFCSKVNENITEGTLLLIKKGFPELNITWLKSGFGDMIEPTLENPNDDNMMTMVRMMHDFIELSNKNSEANLINAEANKLNAVNLERLISIIERKFS